MKTNSSARDPGPELAEFLNTSASRILSELRFNASNGLNDVFARLRRRNGATEGYVYYENTQNIQRRFTSTSLSVVGVSLPFLQCH